MVAGGTAVFGRGSATARDIIVSTAQDTWRTARAVDLFAGGIAAFVQVQQPLMASSPRRDKKDG